MDQVSKFVYSEVVTIDAWLSLIDNHFITRGVTEDSLKIKVLKQYINPESGDAKNVIKLGHLKELTLYEEHRNLKNILSQGRKQSH